MKKRILASLMALCLIVGLLPTAALAADPSGNSTAIEIEITEDTKKVRYTFESLSTSYELDSCVKPEIEETLKDLGISKDSVTELSVSTTGEARLRFADCVYIAKELTGLKVLDITNADFYDDTYAKWLTTPANIDHRIPTYAFSEKSSIETIYPFSGDDRSVTTKFTAIGPDAFSGTQLRGDIVIPDTVTEVAGFNGTKITGINKSGDINYFDGNIEVIGQACVFNTATFTGEVVFGDKVEKISSMAFQKSPISGPVTLGKAIKEIGSSAFQGCPNITSIYVGSSVKDFLTAMAFTDCKALESIIFEDGATATIGANPFAGCSSLKYIYYGDSVNYHGTFNCQDVVIVLSTSEKIDHSSHDMSTTKNTIIYTGNGDVLADLVANWKFSKNLNVIAAMNGGKLSDHEIYGDKTQLAEPVREGYIFGGWYENEDCTGPALADAPQNGKTYYAKWVSRITLNPNGGTCGANSVDVTQGGAYGDLLPTPTRTGYTFQGWYTEQTGGDKVDNTTVPTGNTTLYAQWTPNTYTIQFSGGNGASGSTDSVIATYDQTVTLTANGFTMAGKKFAGWATSQEKANAGTVEYDDQTDVKNLAASGTVTLYAVWTDKQVHAPDLSDTVVTYTGKPQKFHVDDTYTVKYSQNRKEVTDPTNAGIYDVEITCAENETHAAYHAYLMGGLVIDKAQLTVKADNQSIRVGETLPTYTYTVTGLVNGETLDIEPTLTCDTDGKTAGTYDIVAKDADAGANYEISYEKGTLTVTKRSSGGGSSSSGSSGGDHIVSVDADKHGTVTVSPKRADKGDTVTITVRPDKGYELDELTVTDKSGDTVKLKDKGNGKFTFTMPGSKVTVEASFKQIDAEPEVPAFADVPADAWYADAVAWAVREGITTGTGANTFGPDLSCTRAQMVTFLWRANGSPKATGANPFADVSADAYYYDAVLWAAEQGVTSGTSANTFSQIGRAHV